MRTLLAFVALAPVAFAQLDSNSVTVTASRTASLQADQVVFAVSVMTGTDVALNDVVAALQSAGITLSNFVGIENTGIIGVFTPTPAPQQNQRVQWTFALPVPISKLPDTAAQLNSVQQSVIRNNRNWTMSFNVQGTQVSLPLQQAQVCPIPDLINDARVQAQKLASAAGMTAGSVLAMSSVTSSTQPGSGVYVAGSVGSVISASSFLPPQVCTATVKFALK